MDVATLALMVDPAGVVSGSATADAALVRLEKHGTTAANALKGAFQGLAAYLSAHAFLGAFEAVADKTRESTLASARLAGVLHATGEAAGFTAAQLNGLADELSRNTLFDDEAYKNAAAALATFGNVNGAVYERALRLSADLATLQGGDLASSAQQLGKALEDPIRGMEQLARAGIALSTAQRDAITTAIRHNEVAQAQGIILDALQGKVGGLAAGAHSGLTGSLHDLRTAWDNFLEGLGETPGMAQTAANAIALIADSLQGLLLTLQPTLAMIEDTLAEEQARRSAQLTEYVTRTGPRNVASGQTSQADFLAETQRLSDELVSVTARYEAMRKASVDAMHAGTAAAAAARGQVLAVVHDGTEGEKKLSDAHKAAMEMFNRSLQAEATAQTARLAGLNAEGAKYQDLYEARLRMNQDAVDKEGAGIARRVEAEKRAADVIKGVRGDEMLGEAGGGKGGGADILTILGTLTGGGGALAGIGQLLQGVPGLGLIVGIFQNLTSSLLGAGDAARLAAEAEQRLTEARQATFANQQRLAAMGYFETSIWVANPNYGQGRGRDRDMNRGRFTYGLEHLTGEAAALRQLQINYEKELDAARGDAIAIARLNQLRALETDAVKAEWAQRQKEWREDYTLRLLRAQGHDAEADAMALALEQQREYTRAIQDGADEMTLAALKAAQLAEAQKISTDQLKSTLAGLAAFQTSLKFGAGSTASPMQQYAAARAEYEKVLAAAMGGDQSAAGRLPEAARAFLEISRQVNASGMAYQRDLQDVQAAVDAVTALFQGQLDTQQAMLDRLGFDGPIVITIDKHFGKQEKVLVAGFEEQTTRLDTLIDVIARGNDKLARALEGVALTN